MRILNAFVLMFLLVIAGCGGSDSPTTPSAPPAPTPVPVTYNGSYTGTMTYTSGSTFNALASVAVTQSGQTLTFGNLVVTSPISTQFGMGIAALSGSQFEGSSSYSSSGCGPVISQYRGYFSGDGNIMNLTVTLLTTRCGTSDIRGEMRR